MPSNAVAKVVIDQSVDKVWGRLQDLSLADKYVPNVTKVQFVSEKKMGVGASRLVFQGAKDNDPLQETVTEWEEKSKIVLRLHKGDQPSPFKDSFFTYRIDAQTPTRTDVTLTMSYTPPCGCAGSLIDPLLRRIIAHKIQQVGNSMAEYYHKNT